MSIDHSVYEEHKTYYVMKGVEIGNRAIVFMQEFVSKDWYEVTLMSLNDKKVDKYYTSNIIEIVKTKDRFSFWSALLGKNYRDCLEYERKLIFFKKWKKIQGRG